MLIIRFQRVGKKNRPHFRLVVTESKNAAKKKANEILGFYDPIKKDRAVEGERIKYWMSVGARVSPSAHNFLVREKVISAPKIPVHKKPKPSHKDTPSTGVKQQENTIAPTEAAPVSQEAGK